MFQRKKKKNINNGSGDNNNNSNDGEKTKEIVLGHPPNRSLKRLNNFGHMVTAGADTMEPGNERYLIEQQLQSQQVSVQAWLQELQLLPQQPQLLPQLQQPVPYQLRELLLQSQQEVAQTWLQSQQEKAQARLQQLKMLEPLAIPFGDGGGDGDDDSNGSGNDDDGDNDGGDKTEGGGDDGDNRKMGTKMEPKGQHDNRNRFSYHGGDENGYPVGQLHRCYYEKPNVCSIILNQRKNINNGSGDNNNNSNEGEKTKEMVLGLPPNRGQIKLKTFGDMVRTGADPMEPVWDSGYIKNYHIKRPRPLQQWQQLKEQRKKAKAGGDSGGDGNGGGDSGSGSNNNDGDDKTEGNGGDGGKMGTEMKPKGQHDNCNRFSYHGGDENGYAVGQLHRCYYEKPNVCSIMPNQV